MFIGHTRYSTSGPASRNRNNHPFNSQRYSLVHNGGISDWQNVVPKIGLDAKMRTGCDSEMLIHLLEERNLIQNGVQHMMDSIPGSSRVAVATLGHHADLEQRLWLFRNKSNPIFILTIPQWRSIFFASTDSILDDAMKMTYGDELDDVVKRYGISKAELPTWKLHEFGFDKGVPIPMERFDIEERKMGFTQGSASQNSSGSATSSSDGACGSESSASCSNQSTVPPERRLPLNVSTQQNGDDSFEDKLKQCDEETQKEVTSLIMSVDECLPVLKALRAEPMMQNCELDHFKKWMMRVV